MGVDKDVTTDGTALVPKEEWAATEVHRHSTYSCGKCGEGFADPDEFYDHLDEVHPDE